MQNTDEPHAEHLNMAPAEQEQVEEKVISRHRAAAMFEVMSGSSLDWLMVNHRPIRMSEASPNQLVPLVVVDLCLQAAL